MKVIQFSAIVDGLSLRKDNTLSVRLGTQELTPEASAEIFSLGNRQVWVGVSEHAIEKLDVPEEIVEFKGEKSRSERLRNVLYRYWEKKTDKTKNFEDFRNGYMDNVINNIKDKLN